MTNDRKRILVMMSTYNGEKHIREQIDSILGQKTSNKVFLHIRDDGSQDRTCDIIEEYVKKYPEQIVLTRGKNIGYNASFFYLIQNAEGFDYYSISDQDDVWKKNKLHTACKWIDSVNEKIPILYASTSYLVHNDLIPYGTTRKKKREFSLYNTIIQNICPGHSQVFNNELLTLLKQKIDVCKIYVYDSWITNIANLYGIILFDNNPHTYYRQFEGNQLGSGNGKIGQLFSSMKRSYRGDGNKYRTQFEYFVFKNKDKLIELGFYNELVRLINSKSLFKRLTYAVSSKLYRQSVLETVAFRFSYFLGLF